MRKPEKTLREQAIEALGGWNTFFSEAQFELLIQEKMQELEKAKSRRPKGKEVR